MTQEEKERNDLIEFTNGRFAAQRGEPFWPHNTPAWIDGFLSCNVRHLPVRKVDHANGVPVAVVGESHPNG